MARQAVILTIVCGMHKNLKALLEHDRCQKVIGCGGVWRDNEQRHLLSLASSSRWMVSSSQIFMMEGILNALIRIPRIRQYSVRFCPVPYGTVHIGALRMTQAFP